MKVIIGSARIDEKGKISGGKNGDQKQININDYKGEVSLQEFYIHKKGWYIISPKKYGDKLANKMLTACNNANLGYNQFNREGVVKLGISTKIPTGCDCSSLVRQCIKEVYGIDPGNFTTATEVSALEKTGLFNKAVKYTDKTILSKGDILVTCTKGHTAIVVDSEKSKTIDTIAYEVISGKWGNGTERKEKLEKAGYNYKEVQTLVNKIIKEKK